MSEITISESESLKLALTLRKDDGPARPHQAMLLVQSGDNANVETFYTFTVKGVSGKARLEVVSAPLGGLRPQMDANALQPYKDIPSALLSSSTPLRLSVALGSFSSDKSALIPIGTLSPEKPETPAPSPVKYVAQPEITHTFRADPRSPPKILTLVFTLAVSAALFALFGAWVVVGANVKTFPKALGAAPLSYAIFIASLVALEATFFMYYVSWNLFQMLGVAVSIGVVAVLSGRGALSEVKARRLRGEF